MKGGKLGYITRCCTQWLAITAVLFFSMSLGLFPQRAKADPSPLELVRDYVVTTAPGEPNLGHDIYFVLPLSSQQIRPTDWIIIEMTNFSNVQAPTDLEGSFGTPVFNAIGNKIYITNITLLPGSGLNIRGAIASNPPDGASQQEIISVAEDSGGVVIRNQSITYPISTGGYISVSATVESPLSSLTVTGFTGSGAFTTMTEGGAVLATTVADGAGGFNFVLNGLLPGPHDYSIFSSDSQGRGTSVTALSLYLVESTTTNVTGILLSPTISISTSEIDAGDPVTIAGTAKPNSQINIFLEAPLRSYSTTTNGSGSWSFTVTGSETSTLLPGQYQIYTNLQDGIGNQSIASPTVNFRVRTPDSGNPPPCGDISHGDLNCNGVTNLVDFSILLFHWQTNHRVADINSDGRVNLTDFSIMMFYFNR